MSNNKRKLKLFCLATVLGTVSACTAPKYIEPNWDENSTAKIRFVTTNTKGRNVIVYRYEGESCITGAREMAVLSGMALKHNRKRLGFPLGEAFADKMLTESIITAGQPVSFAMAYWGVFKRCTVNFDLHPEPGKMYEVAFNKDKKFCSASLFLIEPDGQGGHQRIPSQSTSVSVNNCTPGQIY